MRKRVHFALSSVIFLLIAAGGTGARGDFITFDDLPGGFSLVPNGYGGLDWSNFIDVDGNSLLAGSGFRNGIVSSPNIAFNGGGNPALFSSTSPFTFVSGYLTGAWRDGLSIEIQGYLAGNLVHDSTITVNTTGPTLFAPNWQNVDTVQFLSSGGTTHPGLTGDGAQFVLDSLTVGHPVPEPSTLVLLSSLAVSLIGFHRHGGWARPTV
ncbi:MAG TPA: PEP-CTERM sorting domain-containing protein [Planctomycetaceae bacterium]|nr:PEP-CTERM sorting domain-containing protein [Planctomycetaceae bacterium]